jgi:hypothetical protein
MNFGYISLVGLALNLIVIPLMSIFYVILFASTIVSAIVSAWAAAIMPIACAPIEAFISFAVGYGFEAPLLSGIGGWVMFVFVLLIMVATSDKFNFKKIFRIGANCTIVCAFVVYVLLRQYMPLGDARIIVSAYYGGGAVIVKTGQGSVLVVTEDMTTSSLSSTVSNYCAGGLKAIVILGGDDCLESYYKLGVTSDNVYIYSGYIPINAPGIANLHYESNFTVCGVTYKYTDGYSVLADVNGVKLGICAGESTSIYSCNLLVSRYAFSGVHAKEKVYFNLKHSQNNIYDCGDLQFSVNSGTISKIGLSHYVQSGG